MPGASGADLAGQIRRAWPDMPILFLSGYVDQELIKRHIDLVDGQVLVKPFDPDVLVRRVRRMLDGEGNPSE